MGNLVLTGVKDVKVAAFVNFAVLRSRGEAMRAFTSECNNAQSMLCQHPADFQLFVIGEIDSDSGSVVPCKDGPVLLADGVSVKEKPVVQNELPFQGGN